MDLRPYQAELVRKVGQAYAGGARTVVMCTPTGSGKTHMAAHLVTRSVAKGNRIVFAAHLDALLDDTSERLIAAGVTHGIVQGNRPTAPNEPVQLCSLATLHRRGETPPADFVICDECHHAASDSVRGVMERYPAAKLLGLTASPQRGDGKPLGDVFDRLVCGPTPAQLLSLGNLVPCEVVAPMPMRAGTIAVDPVAAFEKHATPASRALFFCSTLDEVESVVARLPVHASPFTGEETGSTRRAILAAFRAGELRALVGCTAFSEGLDVPSVDLIISARAMSTCSAWLQACGRGLRPSPATGKTFCRIIDLVGAVFLHGLPYDDRTWSIDGPPVRTGEALTAIMRCRECLAVFHVAPICPRCGASTRGSERKKRLSRVEARELRRVDTMPQDVRDSIALRGIEKRLHASGKFPAHRIPMIALSILRKSRGKAAEVAK